MSRQTARAMVVRFSLAIGGAMLLTWCSTAPAFAQPPAGQTTPKESGPEATPNVPEKVEVEPLAEDEDIATRLTRILDATGWFEQPEVQVDEGVVFLAGRVDSEQHKE